MIRSVVLLLHTLLTASYGVLVAALSDRDLDLNSFMHLVHKFAD